MELFEQMQACIYEIRNTANGKCYIGSSVNWHKRWCEHRRDLESNKHHSIALQRAWNKHGQAAFTFRRLLVCAPVHQVMYEQRILDGLRPEYNVAKNVVATMLGRNHSAETRAQMSIARKGRVFSLEHRARIGAANKKRIYTVGFKQSPETVAKLSAALKGKTKSAEHRRNIAIARLGKTHSPETREKIAAYSRGTTWTEARRAAQPKVYRKAAKA